MALLDNGVAGLLVKSPLSFAYVSRCTGKPFWEKTHLGCLLAEAFVGLVFLRHRLVTWQKTSPPYWTPEEAPHPQLSRHYDQNEQVPPKRKDRLCVQV